MSPLRRAGQPWLLVELIAIAAWARDGDPIATIAARLYRRVREVRAVVIGDAA